MHWAERMVTRDWSCDTMGTVPTEAQAFCPQPSKKKQRAQVVEFFIDVARECFNIGNFNSLMAIICE